MNNREILQRALDMMQAHGHSDGTMLNVPLFLMSSVPDARCGQITDLCNRMAVDRMGFQNGVATLLRQTLDAQPPATGPDGRG